MIILNTFWQYDLIIGNVCLNTSCLGQKACTVQTPIMKNWNGLYFAGWKNTLFLHNFTCANCLGALLFLKVSNTFLCSYLHWSQHQYSIWLTMTSYMFHQAHPSLLQKSSRQFLQTFTVVPGASSVICRQIFGVFQMKVSQDILSSQ